MQGTNKSVGLHKMEINNWSQDLQQRVYLKIINSKNYKNLREIEQWRLSLLYFGYRWRTKRRKEETNDEKEKKNENVEKK